MSPRKSTESHDIRYAHKIICVKGIIASPPDRLQDTHPSFYGYIPQQYRVPAVPMYIHVQYSNNDDMTKNKIRSCKKKWYTTTPTTDLLCSYHISRTITQEMTTPKHTSYVVLIYFSDSSGGYRVWFRTRRTKKCEMKKRDTSQCAFDFQKRSAKIYPLKCMKLTTW